MRRRICSLLLAGLMALSSLGTAAFAEGGVLQNGGIAIGASGLCEHHTEHTADCGYTEGIPEQPCNHEHTDDCYAAVEQCVHTAHDESCGGLEDPSACNHQCSEESGCIVKTLDCRHQHDESCGYVPAVEGTPCNFVCEICGGAEDTAECICETPCTEDAVNPDCPVCSAEGADLTACKGATPEAACTCETLCTEDAVNPDCAVCSAEEADLTTACKGEPTEGEILFSDVMTEEMQRAFEAGLEDDPEPLTLEDVFAADPELEARAAANRAFARSAAQPNPGTYIVNKDNENNAGTGKGDGDMGRYLKRGDAPHPIEANIFIPEGKLPTQSCYIAVRTYDVDWVGALGPDAYHYEYDKLFVNDVRVGTLTGLQSDWNTSYYEVPLSALREGNNTIRVEIWDCEGAENFADPGPGDLQPTPVIYTPEGSDFQYGADWAVSIDWMQLVCDGGSRQSVEEYSLSITNVGVTGDDVQVSAETVITLSWELPCQTEYTITDANGFILGAYHGIGQKGSRTEEFVITMPKGQPDGVYTVTGLLRRSADDNILATDQAFFYLENGRPVLKPRLGHTLSPDSWTKEDVAITVEVKDGQGYQDIRISEPTKTVPQNGEYAFDYSYKTPDGEQKSDTYTVKVENIDKTPPVLSCAPVTVMEETDNNQLAAAIRAGITASDGESGLAGEPAFTLDENFCYTGGEKTVEVTVSDQVGNSTKATCTVTVQALPISIEKPTAVQEGTANRFGLTAELTHPGPDPITETGFVWGVMQNPTLTINNGRSATEQPVANKDGTISVTANDIVDGVNYYCRAYVVAGGKTYYSEQTLFGIGAKQYGTVTIKNNGNSTFTVTRTGGTDGAQTVYYRTVNGSAVGGTHFTHQASTVTIPAGQKEATITIEEKTANTAYTDKPATAYSNADRTYQVEIYRVDGGAVLGTERFATRTMAAANDYNVGCDIYATGEQSRTDISSSTRVYDPESPATKDDTNLWVGRDDNPNPYFVHDFSSFYTGQEVNYLNETARLAYRYVLKGAYRNISNKGYAELWIGYDAPQTGLINVGEKNALNIPNQSWAAVRSDIDGTYSAPGGTNFTAKNENGEFITLDGNVYVLFDIGKSAHIHFGACGNDKDEWDISSLISYARIVDNQEPQLVAVAPLDSSTYRVGDTFTIALVFDEIVDSKNSGLNNNDTVQTTWGQAQYAGGMDTNVLYFEGVVKDGAAGELKLTSIGCAAKIKDMCDTEGSSSTGSGGTAGGNVDNARPTVSISDDKLENGTASAKISAQNYTSLEYTWSESADTPVTGWLPATNGATVSTRQTSGKWYLHVWGYRSRNGTSAYATKEFDFGTPEDPASPMPTLSVTADNRDWAKSRDITVEKTPDNADVSYTGPGVAAAVPVTGNTVEVTENGIYTFVLKSGDETVEKTVLISRIDRGAPVLSITGAGDTGTIYNQLVMSATASDVLSGIKSVEYVFSDSADAPAEGWQPAAAPVDGKYSFTYDVIENQQTKKYLHVRVTDLAGNSVTKTSDGYTVVKKPETAQMPAIRFTTQPTGWVKGPAELTWEVTNPGAGEWEVEADGKLYPLRRAGDPYPEDPQTTGPLAATRNGLYQIQVTDKNNNTGSAELIVNWIDSEAPVAEISVPGGWAREKTVTLANITDNRSPQVDETGSVTGYSGSGIRTQEYKLSTADSWTAFTGDSFAVTQNGTYEVRLTDKVGNSATYTVEVTGIDTIPPRVQLSKIPDGWQSKVEVTLTPSDVGSGVKTVETAFVENKTDTPTDLTAQPIQNGKVTVEAPSGQWYLYYKVTDQVGNSIDGYSSLIQVDGTKPQLTVTGGEQGAETVTFTVQATFGVSGGTVTVTEPDGTEETISGGGCTATKPGSYTFTATSNNANVSPVSVTKQVFQVSFTEQDEPLTQLVVQGGKAVRPADPIRTGYTFTQWQKDGKAYDFEETVEEDSILTAAWTLNAPTGLTIETTYGGSTGNNFIYEKGSDLIFTAHPSHDLSTGIDYSYQWYDEDDQLIDGETEPSYTVTDADAGDYRCSCIVTASVGESTSAGIKAEVTAAIDKRKLEKPAADDTKFIYSGQEQTYAIAPSEYYTVTGNVQTDAGTYTVTVALDDKANCQWADGSTDDLSYTFTIAKLGVEKPAEDNTEFVYSGKEQTYTIAPSDYYAVTGNVQTDAGTHTVTVVLKDKSNYQWADGSTDDLSYTFTIAKMGIEKPAADDTEFIYSGQEQTYTITPSDYYTVTDNVQTEAGTYTVIVALDDKANCQWADGSTDDLSYTFLIAPRPITATWRNLDMVYNGQPQAPQAASLIGVLEADQGSEKVAAVAEEKEAADKYAVIAKLTGTRAHNYILSNDQVEFSIHPAPVTFQVENSRILYDGQSHTAQVAAQALGKDFEAFAVSYRDEKGQTVEAPVEVGRYAVLAQITDGNYRHSGSANGEARQVGVLEIYENSAPALYTITFLPGAEEGEVTGTLPSLPDSLAGGIIVLPEADGLHRDNYEFSGWEYAGRVYQPGAEFTMPESSVTFTAQWAESYDIDGSVEWEGDPPTPAQDILVQLKRGNECLAYTTTDADGRYSFRDVPPDVYNLVISNGSIIRTAKVELIDKNAKIPLIRLPRGETNSILKVKDGTPPVVVGRLDELFTDQPGEGEYPPVYTKADRKLVESGGKVEIRMEAASAEPEPDSPLGQALDALTQGFVPGLTLNLTMEKSREDANGVSQGETPITESNLLMEVVIPLNGDLQNCRDYLVLREHENKVDEITTAENQWGEYFTLNSDGTTLTIFARRFSLYSIVYTNALLDSGGSGDDPSDRPDSRPPEVTEPLEPVVTPVPEVVPQPSETSDIPQESIDSPSEEEVPQPDESQEPSEEPEVPVSNQPEEPSGPADASNGKPFVLLSAVCAAIAVLLAIFGKSRGRARLAAVLCAAGAVVIVLLTTGWSGIIFANLWTLPAAILTLLAGWFTRRSKEVKSEE